MNTHTLAKTAVLLLLTIAKLSSSEAQTGIHGSISVTGSNQDLNSRTWLTADAAAGSTTISVNNSNLNGTYFIGNLSSGDLIMIIQMQGASINTTNTAAYGAITNYNNVGLYEFRCVASVPNSSSIMVTVPLSNNYSASGHTQIVRIPRYTSFTLSSGNSIAPAAWNGNTGGVTVIEVSGNATINGSINATGRGFRGGAFENNTQAASSAISSFFSSNDADGGNKGESIAGFETEYNALGGRFGRGAPANGGGGGNSHNAGGGGGANAGNTGAWNGLGNPDNSGVNWSTAWNLEGGSFSTNTSSGGGRGGYTYGANNQNAISVAPGNSSWGGNNRRNTGGYGGRPLNYSSGRIFMGGGGGAGDGNNSAATGGANGGGIVFIICYGNISGSGSVVSNGATANNTNASHNDAPGGGGGGGAIILSASGSIANTLTLNANGGNGGSQLITNNESEGPGGGGGGGYIAVSSGTPTRTATAGVNGTTSSASLSEFRPNGATRGGAGISNATFSATAVIGSLSVNAGLDQDFCETANLNGTAPANTIGTWSVVSGSGGVFTDIHDPLTLFTGDSMETYTIEWSVINNLCEEARDTMVLSPICQPLPVVLLEFNATYYDHEVLLNWISASEENAQVYAIERMGGNGNWQEIGRVNAHGNSQALQMYAFTDVQPASGENNYRLRMVDIDQSYRYSEVVSVSIQAPVNRFNLFPVPVQTTLNLEGQFKTGMQLELYTIQGQMIETYNIEAGSLFSIDLSHLNSGAYLIKIIRNNETVQVQTIFRE